GEPPEARLGLQDVDLIAPGRAPVGQRQPQDPPPDDRDFHGAEGMGRTGFTPSPSREYSREQRSQRIAEPAGGGVPLPLRNSGWPQAHSHPATRAGLPRTSAKAGTFRVTTDPIPTIENSPSSRPGP